MGNPDGVAVSAPPRVRELLRRAPDGPVPVFHAGPHAVYVAVGDRCVGLLGRGAALVPCGLRSRLRDLTGWPCASAYLESGTLHVDGRPLPARRAVAVRVPPLDPGLAHVGPGPSGSPVAELVPRVTPASVHRIVGLGEGLTPLGDDVLCGWLAAHRAAGVPTPGVDAAVRGCLHRTTLLSATLLECALLGEVLPQLGGFLGAVGTDREPRAEAELESVGGSSGAGMLHGARLAVDGLRRGGLDAA